MPHLQSVRSLLIQEEVMKATFSTQRTWRWCSCWASGCIPKSNTNAKSWRVTNVAQCGVCSFGFACLLVLFYRKGTVECLSIYRVGCKAAVMYVRARWLVMVRSVRQHLYPVPTSYPVSCYNGGLEGERERVNLYQSLCGISLVSGEHVAVHWWQVHLVWRNNQRIKL